MLNESSFRGIFGRVLLRAADGPGAASLFTFDGVSYPVVVALDTEDRRVRISLQENVMAAAIAYARDLWGDKSEGDEHTAISPPGVDMFINDARQAAEFIKL